MATIPTRITEENLERLREINEDVNTAIEILLDRNEVTTEYFTIAGIEFRQRISKGQLGWICEITPVAQESLVTRRM